MAKLQRVGRAAWGTVEDKSTLCSFFWGGGGCLCIVVSLCQALGRLTLQKDSPNRHQTGAFSCAVFTQTDQGSPGCAEVCRSDGSYLATRCKPCPHSEAVSSLLGSASCMPVDLPQWIWVCLSSLQPFKLAQRQTTEACGLHHCIRSWPSFLLAGPLT